MIVLRIFKGPRLPPPRAALTEEMDILVFDSGGITLDVSLLGIGDGVFRILATDGDTHLGSQECTRSKKYMAHVALQHQALLWERLGVCLNQLLVFAVMYNMAHVEVERLVPNTMCL